MNKKFTFILSAALALSSGAFAQRYLGVATGNYLPTKSLGLNPALMADSRVKWGIDLFSFNVGIDQDYGFLNTKNFRKNIQDGVDMSNFDKFLIKGNNNHINLMSSNEVSIFNIYGSIKNKHHFALTNKVRTNVGLRNYDATFLNTLLSSGDNVTNVNAQNMRFNINSWSEIALSYATTLWQNDKSAIAFGATAKYLGGIGFAGINIEDINGTYHPDPAGVNKGYIDARSLKMNAATSANLSSNDLSGDILKRASAIFDGTAAGFGADIGFTYELLQSKAKRTYEMDGETNRPNLERNRYKLRFSAAITDLGSIKYKNTTNLEVDGSGTLSNDSLSKNFDDVPALRNYLTRQGVANNYSNSNGSKVVGMPTALVLGLDYNFNNAFYVNATYINGFIPKIENPSPYTASQISVTPRYENNWLTVGVPLVYNMHTESFKAGLGLRLGGFYIGSDDALAFAGTNKAKGANFYMGAMIPFNKRNLKDRDGDKVSNKLDKCPQILGTWEELGCPVTDKDKDGIVDSLDKCPDVPGVASAHGCPDADGDGVKDSEDQCPNEFGLAGTNGCPDRDGDGVADKDDKCPDVAGKVSFQGCNDTDGDGLADWEDQCPEKAGPIANNGCPDTDNDGIPDHLDKCPTVPGTKTNQGCPEIKAEVKKRLAFAATAIQFETGKAVIKKTSYKMLNEIVAILNEYSDYNMTIDGHTDNTGKADRNMILSQERADAVRDYFVSKGIAEDRLTAKGHGQEEPVADNKTAAGRAKNRRVDMDLKLK